MLLFFVCELCPHGQQRGSSPVCFLAITRSVMNKGSGIDKFSNQFGRVNRQDLVGPAKTVIQENL